jgi:hypothetical protein
VVSSAHRDDGHDNCGQGIGLGVANAGGDAHPLLTYLLDVLPVGQLNIEYD